jgi:hypothetical protein
MPEIIGVWTILDGKGFGRNGCKLLDKEFSMSMLAWLATKITGEAIKTGGEVAKTATEIPKNLVETQKARLEVEELKLHRAERESLITPATFEQVKEYDPKVARIEKRIRRAGLEDHIPLLRSSRVGTVVLLFFLTVLASFLATAIIPHVVALLRRLIFSH